MSRARRIGKALKAALEKSAEFHGRAPKAILRKKLQVPKAMIRIGVCAQVDYVSNKWDGKFRRYFHEFEGEPEIYATAKPSSNGENMLIIVGKFKIEADGIIG